MSRSSNPAIIAGVAMTPFFRTSGRSELQLARDAIEASLEDAGLSLDDVDGLVTFSMDRNDPIILASALALGDVRWFSTLPYGGGQACATVQDAALAIEAGVAEVVVAYRAANMRSGLRLGQPGGANSDHAWGTWSTPFGLVVPAHRVALWFHRYMHEFGIDNAALAAVCVSARDFASTNPAAYFYGQPLSVEAHQASRWVAEPVLRLVDCCLETDAGAAIVITNRSRAGDLRQRPVTITAAARGLASGSTMLENCYRDRPIDLPDLAVVGQQLYDRSGLRPDDVDVALLYDSFSPIVFGALEALGFCGLGEAPAFVSDGHIGRDGSLPVNPNGGMLAEAYLHGFNGIIEAVRQLRGAAVNQIPHAECAVVTSGTGLPSSGLMLTS